MSISTLHNAADPRIRSHRQTRGRGMVYESILDTVGDTPVVKLEALAPAHCSVYVKLESFNPMGSVKDRLAIGVIEEAERSGRLRPGQTVIEATSGNTGIGLAMVCARKGYPLVIVMAENFSVERRRLMRFLGAQVVLTPAAKMGSGMLAKARELADAHGWFLCGQFENEANADIHSQTTAPEILADFKGRRLDCFVSGYGTGGTLKGVARVLRQERPGIRIVAAEPDNSPLLGSGVVTDRTGAESGSYQRHPAFRPHLMQGWTPDFVSDLTRDAVDAGLIDEVVPVSGARALELSRELARREGIFTGITGGATLAAALEAAQRAEPGSSILCMLPDTGERYLSTPLFEDIDADMDEAELDISRSTPSCRFDAAVEPAPKCAPAKVGEVDLDARRFVDEAIDSPKEPVVMFALEWCEFCWSLRKLFNRLGLDFRAIDLDSAAYQKDDRGIRVRQALNARTGWTTIPQVFVGGEFVGGCNDVLDALADGRFHRLLARAGVDVEMPADFNPKEFLPRWVQPRVQPRS